MSCYSSARVMNERKILHCLRAHYPADRQNLVLFELESSLCFCRVSMKSVEAVKKKTGKIF